MQYWIYLFAHLAGSHTRSTHELQFVGKCVNMFNRQRRDGRESNQKPTTSPSNFRLSPAHSTVQPREQTYLSRHRRPVLRDEQKLILLPRDRIAYKRQNGDSVALCAPRGTKGALPLPAATIGVLPRELFEADPPKVWRVERLRGENRRSALWDRSSSPHVAGCIFVFFFVNFLSKVSSR